MCADLRRAHRAPRNTRTWPRAGVPAAESARSSRHTARPQPGRRRACMDLSDGLADGYARSGGASGDGMTIDAYALPIEPRRRPLVRSAWAVIRSPAALTGGDDYELLFTVPCAAAWRGPGSRRTSSRDRHRARATRRLAATLGLDRDECAAGGSAIRWRPMQVARAVRQCRRRPGLLRISGCRLTVLISTHLLAQGACDARSSRSASSLLYEATISIRASHCASGLGVTEAQPPAPAPAALQRDGLLQGHDDGVRRERAIGDRGRGSGRCSRSVRSIQVDVPGYAPRRRLHRDGHRPQGPGPPR